MELAAILFASMALAVVVRYQIRRRTRDPLRLIAAVASGAGAPLVETEPVLDAMRAMVPLKGALPTAYVRALPQSTARPFPSSLEARRKVSTTEVVLARTSGHLLVLHGDIKPINTLLAQIPLADIRSVEVGEMSMLGQRKSLLGLTFADGTALSLSTLLSLPDLTRRFADPLTSGPS